MTRRSLRDRNRAAIAPDPEPALDPAPPHDEPEATPKKAASRTPRARAAGETARLGIYLTPGEFTAAKAAYLADWNNGGQADTFARWISHAIDAHARRTPDQRAEHASPRGRAATRTGATRSFSVPTDTVERMREAINADHQAGQWPSDSAWCGEAIARAVEVARDKNGGHLPPPPPRLPNRLTR